MTKAYRCVSVVACNKRITILNKLMYLQKTSTLEITITRIESISLLSELGVGMDPSLQDPRVLGPSQKGGLRQLVATSIECVST